MNSFQLKKTKIYKEKYENNNIIKEQGQELQQKKEKFCNNCGYKGHNYSSCKYPITSIGIICFYYDISIQDYKFLMIRRRNTLGFVEFIRGKYNLFDKSYIMNLINEMTFNEKEMIKNNTFEELWNYLWNNSVSVKYRNEKSNAMEKYELLRQGVKTNSEIYTLDMLVNDSKTNWNEEEWGFPKGRRNYQEKDIATATREFYEETGINTKNIQIITNLLPFEEIFTGSNFKSYKHKYYLAEIKNETKDFVFKNNNYQKSEVSKIEWKSIFECVDCIRDYNIERKQIIQNIYSMLKTNKITYF